MSVNDASKIIIEDSRVMLQIVAPLTDNSRGVIYNRNMFIVAATRSFFKLAFSSTIGFNVIISSAVPRHYA